MLKVTFLELIYSFWKIQNVNRPYDNVRSRDPCKCPIRAADSASLNDLTF